MTVFLSPLWQRDHRGNTNFTKSDLSRLEKLSEVDAVLLFSDNKISDQEFLHVLGYFELADLEKKRVLITVTGQCFSSGDETLLKEAGYPFLFSELGHSFPSETQGALVETGVIDTLLLLENLIESKFVEPSSD